MCRLESIRVGEQQKEREREGKEVNRTRKKAKRGSNRGDWRARKSRATADDEDDKCCKKARRRCR